MLFLSTLVNSLTARQVGIAGAALLFFLVPLRAPAQLLVNETQPESGAPGTTVRIYGVGFSTTITDNTVEFGGTQATINSATSTVLSVQVPSGPNGPVDVTVTTPDSSVTIPNPFVVTTGGEASFPSAEKGLESLRNGATAWGDVDGDGDLDLVVAGENDAGVEQTTLYLNDGNGNFSVADAGLTGVHRAVVALGDVEGDGDLDLVVAGRTGSGDPSTTLYLNDGSGNFSAANAGLTNVDFPAVDFGDVNGDGALDLVVSGNDMDDSTSTTLYLNDGFGGFSAANAGLTNLVSGSADFADVDGDGDLDLLLTGEDVDNFPTTTLYLNDGTGTFSSTTAGLLDLAQSASDVADVDGDGDLDLVLSGSDGDGVATTTIYLNDGTGTFSAASTGLQNLKDGSATFGDVNGDGSPDLLVTGVDADLNKQAALYTNDGTGAFSAAQTGLLGVSRSAADFGDADGDGDLDLALTGSSDNGPRTLVFENTPVTAKTTLSVTNLRPRSGRPGTAVRIDGSGFSATASNNTVEFGGAAATVDSASTTTLFVQVPSGVSGSVPVSVTTPDSSATAASRFNAVTTGSESLAFFRDLPGVSQSTSNWGDFNGDGNPDLFVAGGDSLGAETATVYLGDGSGGFTEAGAGLTGVVDASSDVGDVNGDGNLDLVVSGTVPGVGGTTTVYLGDGAGGFTEASAVLPGVFEGATEFADFNEDGNLDLLLTGDGAAAVYLGDGEGGFVRANAGLTGVQQSSSAIGDVDNDGHLDLVVTGRDVSGIESATVYLGDGTGGFTEATALTGVDSGSSTLGDVDGDGNLDLLVTGSDGDNVETATVYLGDGTGGFTAANAGLTGVQESSSDVGDINNDGNLDLVVTGANADGNPTTTIYFGDGTGGFTAQSAGLSEVRGGSSILGDVDGDGDLDLFLTGSSTTGLVSRLYENEPITAASTLSVTNLRPSSGGAGTPVRIDGSGFSPTASDNTVDFGGTSATIDSATTTTLYVQVPSGISGAVPVSVTTPDGSVTAAERFGVVTAGDTAFVEAGASLTGVTSSSSNWGDFDGDGNLDLLVTGTDAGGFPTATLYLGDGTGSFIEAGAGLTPVRRSASAVGDINGDGNLDLVITGTTNNAPQATTVYLGDGTGGFTEVNAGLPGVTNGTATLADVNADGNLDLVVTGAEATGPSATVYLGYGDGRFAGTAAGLTGVGGGSVSVGDLNNDGTLDLVVTGEDANSNKTTTTYLGDGTGGFTATDSSLTDVSLGATALGDLNGDGNLDVVVTGENSNVEGTAAAYLGDGTGGFSLADSSLTDVTYSSTALRDFDGDGTLDLVVTGEDANFNETTTLYLGDGSGAFAPADAGLVGVREGSASAGDFDGDGALDLAVTGTDTSGSPSARVYGNGGITISAPPEIAVTPSSLNETLALGDSSAQSLQIENAAADTAADLTFAASIKTSMADASSKRALSQQHPRGTAEWTSAKGTTVPSDTRPAEASPKTHSGTPPVVVDDPLGDADSVDVDRVRAGLANDQINVVIEHAGPVEPTNYAGIMAFDVDQDTSTGVQSDFLNSEQAIGAEYEVSFFELDGGTLPLMNAETGETIDSLQVRVDSSAIHFAIPLTKINGTPPVDMVGVVGTASGPTDWVPNTENATIGASWLTVSPSSGSISPGASQTLDVSFIGRGTPPGTYEGAVRITSNDPTQDTTEVPVSLTIEPPGITLNNPSDLPGSGDAASIGIDFPSGFAPVEGTFFYRPAGARTFDTTTVDLSDVAAGGSASVSIPGSAVTNAGVQYYVRLRGTPSATEETVSFSVPVTAPVKTGFLPVRTGQVGARGTFESGAYRMLTVPLDLGDRSVFDALEERYGTYDESDWKLARWAPSDSSYRFGSAIDSLRPGQAAWLVTAAGDSLTVQNARSADASGPRSMSLGPGWNQIGSPFSFPVAWADVDRPEGVRAPVAYDTTGYQFGVTRLRPWRGAFVFNQADSTVTVQVPPVRATEEQPTSTGKSLATAASTAPGYRMQVIAKAHREGRTLTGLPTWLGFSKGAAETGLGPKDRVKPPAVGPHVSLHVAPEEGPALARSLKPVPSDGAIWDLRVGLRLEERLDGPQQVTIVLNEQGTRPSDFQRYVLDRDRGRRLSVTNRSVTVKLTEDQPTRHLRVIVGTEAFAKQNSDGAALTIEKTKLQANAPNPFSESTTIAYQLAEEETVEIAVYDVLGRRVQTLVSERQKAGVHEIEWRPGEAGGASLASGVYFCRMEAGDYTATRKVVLVR